MIAQFNVYFKLTVRSTCIAFEGLEFEHFVDNKMSSKILGQTNLLIYIYLNHLSDRYIHESSFNIHLNEVVINMFVIWL